MPAPQETYVNSVQRRGYSDVRIQAPDFGAAGETIGKAAAGFGQDLGQVAQNLTEIQKQDAQTAAQEADNMRVAQRMKYFYDGDDAFFNRTGKDAVVAAQNVPKDLQKIDDDVAAQLLPHNQFALKMYKDMTLRRNNDDMPQVYRYTNQQRTEHEKSVDAATFDMAIDQASTSLDPKVIEQGIATAGNIAVRQLLRTREYDPNLIEQTRQAAVGKAVAGVAKRMELKSPSEAQAFVTTHAGMMDPQDAASLLEALATPAAQETADANVDQFIVQKGGSAPLGAAGGTASTDPLAPKPDASSKPTETPVPPPAALEAAQWAVESSGKQFDARGNLVSSGKSIGISQLYKGNRRADGSWDFGYGVVGPRDNSEAEYRRVGNDYRNALIKHYNGNVVLGLTAYNWGVAHVDAHIKAVGDPRTGSISDSAWVNSIPIKEAREYAPKVLLHAGVNVASRDAAPAGQQAGYYGPTGEIDLDRTVTAINASDKTFIEKQALIAVATRRATLAKQTAADAKEQLTDQVWTQINSMGDNFTDYNKLPLNLRQQLASSDPRMEAQFRGMADANLRATEAAAAKQVSATGDKSQEDLIELSYQNPDAFSKIDLRTAYPELDHGQRTSLMAMQHAYQESRDKNNGPNYDAMRTMFTRYAGSAVKADQGRMGFNFQEALRQEQAVLGEPGRNGKPLTDVEREAIVRRVLMPVVIHATTGNRVVTRAEAPTVVHSLGQNFRGADADLREQARSAFILNNKRIPSPAELDDAVEQWHRLHPTGLQYRPR